MTKRFPMILATMAMMACLFCGMATDSARADDYGGTRNVTVTINGNHNSVVIQNGLPADTRNAPEVNVVNKRRGNRTYRGENCDERYREYQRITARWNSLFDNPKETRHKVENQTATATRYRPQNR